MTSTSWRQRLLWQTPLTGRIPLPGGLARRTGLSCLLYTSQETGASSATVSRVNRMLNYGTGALEEVMERVDQQKGVAKEETETRRTE